jgi:DNA adenine methylase
LRNVIKWSGSKRLLAPHIAKYFVSCNTYYEPFLGSGALVPYAKVNSGKHLVLSDKNADLIAIWQMIKSQPYKLMKDYQERWYNLSCRGKEYYYEVRNRFNKEHDPSDFLFLTRTAINGQISYNKSGEFNSSFHLTRAGINPATLSQIIFDWHNIVKDATFINTDYQTILNLAKKGDFVFLDPPYSGESSRRLYTADDFPIIRFFNDLEALNTRGVEWLMTFASYSEIKDYGLEVPVRLYKYSEELPKYNSSFKKLMQGQQIKVTERLYTNYECGEGS